MEGMEAEGEYTFTGALEAVANFFGGSIGLEYTTADVPATAGLKKLCDDALAARILELAGEKSQCKIDNACIRPILMN